MNIAANIPPPPQEGQIPGPLSSTPSVHEQEKLNVGNLGIYAEAVWKPIDAPHHHARAALRLFLGAVAARHSIRG